MSIRVEQHDGQVVVVDSRAVRVRRYKIPPDVDEHRIYTPFGVLLYRAGEVEEHGPQMTPPPKCVYLGDPIERQGVTLMVKCCCNKGEREEWAAAYGCAIYGRCLPTMIPADLKAWRERKPESELYHLCHGCESRK